jgi:hypothetical protein
MSDTRYDWSAAASNGQAARPRRRIEDSIRRWSRSVFLARAGSGLEGDDDRQHGREAAAW